MTRVVLSTASVLLLASSSAAQPELQVGASMVAATADNDQIRFLPALDFGAVFWNDDAPTRGISLHATLHQRLWGGESTRGTLQAWREVSAKARRRQRLSSGLTLDFGGGFVFRHSQVTRRWRDVEPTANNLGVGLDVYLVTGQNARSNLMLGVATSIGIVPDLYIPPAAHHGAGDLPTIPLSEQLTRRAPNGADQRKDSA